MKARSSKKSRTLAFMAALGLMAAAIPAHAQLVAHWSFDSDLTTDSSGNGLNTATTNGPTHETVDTAFGIGAADFDRASVQYLELASGVNLSNKSFTVSCWIKRASLGGGSTGHYIFSSGTTPHRGGFLHAGLKNNAVISDYYYDGWTSSASVVDTNDWHHLVLSFDAAAQKQSIWLDGTFKDDDDTVGLLHDGAFTIGKRADNSNENFDGLIDEMWVFEEALTSYEISDLYSANQFSSGAQSAYATRSLPGRIGAELFDNGGQSTAYVDSDSANTGNASFRTGEAVDIDTGDGGSNVVAGIQNEEWLEFTTASIGAGLDTIALRVACTNSEASVDLFVDSAFIGNVRLPNTGGLNVWETITRSMLDIPAGSGQVVRLRFNGDGFKINWFDALTEVQTPYAILSFPGTAEAENYDAGGAGAAYRDTTAGNNGDSTVRSDDVDLSNADGGVVVSQITDDEWLEFTVESIAANMNAFFVRVASTNSNASVDVYVDYDFVGSVSLPDTGALSTWHTVKGTGAFLFPEGSNVQVRLEFNGGGFSLNSFSVASERAPYVTHVIPGIIEAEHYDYGGEGEAYHDTTVGQEGGEKTFRPLEDVETVVYGSIRSVGYTRAGEWLEYTVEDMPVGMDIIEFSVSGDPGKSAGKVVHVLANDTLVGSIDIPTNGWNSYQTRLLKNVSIPSGSNVILRLEMPEGNVNLNNMNIYSSNTPFTTNYLPGRVEFEDYDLGGEGFAYHDDDPDTNRANKKDYRVDDGADLHQASAVEGTTLEWNNADEWVVYTIAEVAEGVDTLEFRVAAPSAGKYFTIYADGEFVCQVDVPQTGDWQSYTNIFVEDIEIPAGSNVALKFLKNTGGYNLNWFEATGSAIEPTYAAWAAAFMPTDIGAATNDYDGDGFDNLYEYALNGDPTLMDGGGQSPVFTYNGSGFDYVHLLRNNDTNLTYQVQTRTSLTVNSWLDSGFTIEGTNLTSGVYDEVTNSIPDSSGQMFIRLKVINN